MRSIQELNALYNHPLQSLFDSVPFGLLIQAADGTIITANRLAQEILEMTSAQVQGQDAGDLALRIIHEDGSPFLRQDAPSVQALRSGQPVCDVIMAIHHPRWKEVKWISVTAIPQFDLPGEPPDMALITFEDITQRKQMEAALRQSEEKFSLAFYKGPVARLIMRGPDHRLVDVNERFLAQFEYTREQVIGRTPSELQLLAEQEYPDQLERIIMDEAIPSDYELTLMTHPGTPRRILLSTQLINLEGVDHYLLALVDITERKRAEGALRLREAALQKINTALHDTQKRLELAIRSGKIGLWDWDILTDQIIYSPEWKNQLGYADDEIGDEFGEWESRLHPEDRARALEKVDQYLKDPTGFYQNDFRLRHKDGSYRWMLGQGALVYDAEGKPVRMLGANIDITELENAQLALIQSREDYRSLIESLDNMVAKLDWDGRYCFVNSIAADRLNLTVEEIVGKTLFDFFPPEEANQNLADIHQVMESRIGLTKELEFKLPDGTPHWVRSSLQPVFNHEGKAIQVVLSATNITDLKLAQQRLEERSLELLQANAELTRANQAKSDFLAMMSHELRTPLSSILMSCEILQEGIYGELLPRQVDRLNTIHLSGMHLLQIISDILDFSKLEAREFELHPEPVVVDAACLEAVQMVRQQAVKKRLSLSTSLDMLVGTATLDPHRLKQILVNLLSNAVKFTPEGGQVGLEVCGVNSDTGAPMSLRFTVWDTGIGIPAEMMDRLFKPFVQLDSSLSRHYEGTGMGLILVERLVELMGGSVGVESQVGQGSRFWFVLPMHPPARGEDLPGYNEAPSDLAQTPGEGEGAAPQENGSLVLVVEDNLNNLESLVDLLKARGLRIITATNGAEAIKQSIQYDPDTILMDIQMPVMDGLAAIRKLRAMPKFAQTRIIALTALVMPGDRERCLQAGADDYLEKPVNIARLIKAIQGD